MISFDVKADVREVNRYLTDVQKRHVPKATVMALNRAGKATLTVARRDTAKSIGLPAKEIKDKLVFSQARSSRMIASVIVTRAGYKAMNLIKWKAKESKRGVRYRMHGAKLIENAFISPGRGGNLLVFRRVGNERYPIIAKTGPSVANVFRRQDVQRTINARARERFPLEFNRALKRKLATTSGRA